MANKKLKAVAEIELKADRFTNPAKQVTSAINKVGKTAKKAFTDTKSSADKASSGLDKVKGKANKTGSSFSSLGRDASGASTDMKNMGASATQASTSLQNTSLSTLALGSAITGVSDGLFGFAEKALSLERAAFGLSETTEDLIRLEEDYALALKDTTQSQSDLTRMAKDLQLLRENLKIETRELAAQEQALNGEYISFVVNTASVVLVSYASMNNMLSVNQKAIIATKLSTILYSKTMRTLIFDLKGFRVAMIGATLSLKGFRTGVRATMTALGPIGIAMIAIGVAFEVWETNAFGVQEKMADLWELLKKVLPVLQLLETAVTAIFPPEAMAQVEQYSDEIDVTTQKMDSFGNTISETTKSLSGYDVILGQTTDSQDNFNTNLTSTLSNSIPQHYQKMTSELDSYNKSLKVSTRMGDSWIKMQEKVSRFNQKKTNDLTDTSQDLTSTSQVMTAGLARQLESNARINKQRHQNIGKTASLQTIREGFASIEFRIAQAHGLISRTGIQRRHQAHRRIALGKRRGQEIINIFKKAGLSVSFNPADLEAAKSLIISRAQQSRLQKFSVLFETLNLTSQQQQNFVSGENSINNLIPSISQRTNLTYIQIQDFISSEAGIRSLSHQVMFANRSVVQAMIV